MPPPMRLAAAVPQPGVIGGSPGDRQIERGIGQHERLPRFAGSVVPAVQHLDEPFAQRLRLEDAAIEENRGRRCRFLAGGVLMLEKRGQMPGHRGIADIGQSHFVETAAGAAYRLGIGGRPGEEAVEDDAVDISSGVNGGCRVPPMTARPRPTTVTGCYAGRLGAEQRFLGRTAGLGQQPILGGIEPAGCGQFRSRRIWPGPGPCCRRPATGDRRPPGGRNANSPCCSTASIRLKSLVPPPTSTTTQREPGFRAAASAGGWVASQQ